MTFRGTAEFVCKHTNADFVGWRINGTSVGNTVTFPNNIHTTVMTDTDGIAVHTLTIEAQSEYNETIVDCVALSLNPSGSEFSPNVTLRIQGGHAHYLIL